MTRITEDEKLVMLGLKQPTHQSSAASGIIGNLQAAFGDDYDDFKSAYEADDPQDFDDFQSFLTDNDVDDAEAIRNAFEDNWDDDFADFDADIRSFESYVDLENAFGSGSELRSNLVDEDGFPAAGIKVFESAGLGREGQLIPSGGVEVFGNEVYFSEVEPVVDVDDPGDEVDDTTYQFDYSNLEIEPTTTPTPGQTITVSAVVSNPSSFSRSESVQLRVDDEVDSSEFVLLPAQEATSVEFEWSSADYVSVDITIGPLDPITVTVVHPSLI